MRHRALPWLVLLALCAGAADAADGARAACTLVFGQGRNTGSSGANLWDSVNEMFSAQVAATIEAHGRRVIPLMASASSVNPAATGEMLLRKATESGCTTIVETTMFADPAAAALVVRLRVYPVLLEADAQTGLTGARIGPPLYANQRDFELSQATLDRVKPAVLGAQMAAEYLDRDGAAR